MWACTSGSFVYGWEGAHEQIRALARAAGLPASSTSFAFAHAVRELGAQRVAVAATYPEDVAALFAAFLRRPGPRSSPTGRSGIVTAAEVGTWGRDEVLELARAGDHPDAEVVLLPGHGPAHRGVPRRPGGDARQAGAHREPGDGVGGAAAGATPHGPSGVRPDSSARSSQHRGAPRRARMGTGRSEQPGRRGRGNKRRRPSC